MNIRNRPRLYNLLHFLKMLPAQSQTHPDERACLCRHIRSAQSAVEIGTYMGLTAIAMAAALPDGGVLYCVDPYLWDSGIRAVALREIKRSGQASRIRMLRTFGEGSLAMLPEQVDFFFVDGDHSYEGLQSDWSLVHRLLRVGGVAGFHDTARSPKEPVHSEGSIHFFNSVIARDPQFELVERVLSLNIVRRKA